MESKSDIRSDLDDYVQVDNAAPDNTFKNTYSDDDILPKKRLKDSKRNEHLHNDTLKGNLDTDSEESAPVKKKKLQEKERSSNFQEFPTTSNPNLQLAASIFGSSRPYSDKDTRKHDFEPAEQREKYIRTEDDLICEIDIPERLQKVFKNRESPSETELSLEVNWIFNKIQSTRNIECPNSLKSKISQFLYFYRVEKYEIPFISRYRMNILKPELHCDLWQLHNWDKEWGYLYSTKQSMKLLYETSEKNRQLLSQNHEIDSNSKVLTNKNIEIEKELETYPINYIYNISDLEEFFKVHIYTYIKEKKSFTSFNALQEIRKSNIINFINTAGLNPIQFSENLINGLIIHTPCKIRLTPYELAFEFISSTYSDELQIINAACLLMKTELAVLPSIRYYIRNLYLKYVKIYTSPTEKGIISLGVFHPYYRVKNLAQGKNVETWSGEMWAEVLKCEEQGLINVRFKLPWKCEINNREDKILKTVEKYYLSIEENDIENDWNLFRIQVLKQALEQIYEDTADNIRKNLTFMAKEYIKLEVQTSFYSLINQGTYVKKNGKIIAFVTDPNVQVFGSSCLALLNGYGELIDEFTLDTLAVKKPECLIDTDKFMWMKDKCTFAKMVLKHQPDAIAIAANSLQALVLRKNVMGIIEKLQIENFDRVEFGFEIDESFLLRHLIPVFMIDPQVPRLFATSQRSKRMIPDCRMLGRMAISTARMLQNPCAETLSLGTDPNELQIKYLNLHPLQSLLYETEFLSAIEIVSVEYVSQSGVVLNEIIQLEHMLVILNFIPGLGPIKAQKLLHCLQKKLKKRLKTRAELKEKHFLEQRVYENAASFFKITYESQENNLLDSTRIHPESYDLAIILAKSITSDLPLNDKDLIKEVMNKPNKLQDLDLKKYAQVHMDHTGINIEETLECIIFELKMPYFTNKKIYKDISPQNIMYLVTGENKNTLEKGRIAYVNVIRYDESKKILKCHLECGLEGIVEADMIPPARFQKKDSENFRKGEILIARIIEIAAKVKGKDVFFNINLSLLPEDIENHSKFFQLSLDDSFVIDKNDWEERLLFDNEYKNKQKYVPRISIHPKFKNIGLKTACEELANKNIGECIFRPSSRGDDHLTCSWKFYNLVYSHLDINEEGKPAINMLGVKFRISNDTYDSLQEIIDKYIDPCVNLIIETINHAKFQDSISSGVKVIENLIIQEKRARPSSIPYYFTICQEYPQYIVLYYMPKEEIIIEFIKVKPKGLFFHEAYHPNINFLVSWFKRHYSDKAYKNQLELSKPPVIDTNIYSTFCGNNQIEEVLNNENLNPNTQQNLPETKSHKKNIHVNLYGWDECVDMKNDWQTSQNSDKIIEKTPVKNFNHNNDKIIDNKNWGQEENKSGLLRDPINNMSWGCFNAWNSSENIVENSNKEGINLKDKNNEGKGNCFKCGQPGHISKGCQNLSVDKIDDRSCYNCGKVGHISKECPSEKKFNNGDCFKCGEPGHKSKDCPNKKPVNDDCFTCGMSGHKSKDCPNKKLNNDNCFNCGQPGHKSKDCSKEKIPTGDCFKCGQPGHKSKDCQKEKSIKKNDCFNCGKPGHISKDCPNGKKSNSGECFNCGKLGHWSKDCPNEKKPNNGECFNCGQLGHRSRDCPNPKKERNRESRGQSKERRNEKKNQNFKDKKSKNLGEDSGFGAWGSNTANCDVSGWGNQGWVNDKNNSSWGNDTNSGISSNGGWNNSSNRGNFSSNSSNGIGWECPETPSFPKSNSSWGNSGNNSGW
ncbi:hypothetical protein SteCoe_8277 [Stentor coeruleus]|uniref:CCHC-type domain-containing protein n=1 Tax=Stentor coeruleus TaxID=5963 RepID=A0A1R2CKM5_9CILI|nr:hypothetical protein SteCoe_8277 [Stentor coeruleus]